MPSSFYSRIEFPHSQMGVFMIYLTQQQKAKIEIIDRKELHKLEPYLSQQRSFNPDFLLNPSRVRKVMLLELTVTPREFRRLIAQMTDGEIEAEPGVTTFQLPAPMSPTLLWYIVLHCKRTPLHLPKKVIQKRDSEGEKWKLEVALKAALAVEDYRAAAKLQQELRMNYSGGSHNGAEKGKKGR